MQRNLLFVFALFATLFTSDISAQVLNWVRPVGATGIDIALGNGTDANGNIYTTGYYNGTVDFDPGPATVTLTAPNTSIFVTKHDSLGNLIWARSIGGTAACVAYGIAVDASGGSYITGYINGVVDCDPGAGTYNLTSLGNQDIVNIKLNTSGNFVWAHRIGAVANQSGRAIAYDGASSIYVTGINRNGPDFNPQAGVFVMTAAGLDDAFVLKLDTAGIFVWAKNFNGASNTEAGYTIACDPTGDVIIGGEFSGATDFDPNAGTATLTPAAGQDGFVVKLTSAGNYVWACKVGSTLVDIVSGLCTDASGNVIVTGRFTGTVDFDPGAGAASLTSTAGGNTDAFVWKLTSAGAYFWAGRLGAGGDDVGLSVKTDAAGNMYSIGFYRQAVDFDPGAGTSTLTAGGLYNDAYILKLSSAGAFVWAKSYGGSTGDDAGTAIAVSASGSILNICGYFQGTADLDPDAGVTNATSSGVQDIFFMRLGACVAPAQPTNTTAPANQSICYNSTTSLSVSGTGTLGWYTASTGGTYLGGGTSFTTPALTASVVYYVQDSNSCAASPRTSITVSVNPQISSSIASQTNVSCNGGSNGAATVSVSGGTTPFSFSWAPSGGTGASVSGRTAGTYTCTITDATGCTQTQTVSITQPTAITSSVSSQTNILCNGGSNGAASVSVSGGTPGYTYSWAPSGGTGASITGRPAGVYTCTITDANGCTRTQTANITQPAAITSSVASQTNVSCNGGNNGAASVTVSGGTPGYTYSWSPSGGTAATATTLSVGAYACTITDANGCTQTQTVSITQPTAITTSVTASSDVTCNGGSNGSASVTASGGAGGYTYSWSPSGGTSATATGLAAATYTCTITDANACSTTQTVSITEPAGMITTVAAQSDVQCNGGSDGSISINVTGGAGGYTYSWLPSGGTASSATGLSAGTYSCVITDANSCTTTQTVSIAEPTALSATVTFNDITCNGADDGTATVSVSGGTPGYDYMWTPSGGIAATETGLAAGTYSCDITDANGCSLSATVSITEPAALASSQTVTVCFGDTYTVGSNTYNATGIYTDVLTSLNGCDSTVTTDLTVNTQIDVTTTVLGSTATANQNGATYQWIDCLNGNAPLPGETNQSFTPAVSGDYAVIVTVGSCSDTSACTNVITGINAVEVNAFSVYPNPTNGVITILLNQFSSDAQIEVFNALGQLVISEKTTNAVTTVELPQDNGIYLVRVTVNGMSSAQKVIKE